jgi:RNA polymerase sigma-70 factor (ECF subfamily)
MDLAKFWGYNRKLHCFLSRRWNRPQDVDDLAQQVFERICRADEEKIVEKPLAYLYGVASHVLADHIFDTKHQRIDWAEDVDEHMEDIECWLPDDMADRLNLQQQINKALAQLPPTHAAVLLCHKRDGLSYTETAEKLGLSVFTVEKYLTQGKAKLRTMAWDRGAC